MENEELSIRICPNCGSDNTEVMDADVTEKHCYDEMYCYKCNKLFLFTYELTDVREVTKEK